MKIKRLVFDEAAYKKEYQKTLSGLKNINTPIASFDFEVHGETYNSKDVIDNMMSTAVPREQFETTEEYTFLGTATKDGKPQLVVYDEAGVIKSIDLDGCTVVEDGKHLKHAGLVKH